jgi:hypothetical protein
MPERILIADMHERNSEPRLWALDLSNPYQPTVVLQTWVEHGIGSDPKRTGYATQFGNKVDSKMTSTGLYAVGERYRSLQYDRWSYQLLGLDSTNSNALIRGIALHPSKFVTAQHQDFSEGCAAVPENALPTLEKAWGSVSGTYLYVDGKGAPIRTCAAYPHWPTTFEVSVVWQTPKNACSAQET